MGTCIKEGDKSLNHKQLKPCTQSNDGTTTGWTRSGSCNWDPTDGGYHEVCVTMSDKFLAQSAKHDGNDLRSVVKSGGHWCICAWAFASAVTRDPVHLEVSSWRATAPMRSCAKCTSTSLTWGKSSPRQAVCSTRPALRSQR